MARIPDTELERLKRELSLTRLIEAQGLKLISQGKDLACRCPWHDGDDTPSCIVSPKTNLWHCFGCDAGGSVIDWVMRMHRVSFRHACELLAKQHPALAAAPATSTAPTSTVKLSQGKLRTAQSFSLGAGDQELLDQVIDFYHTTLKASPEALEYLERRGLGNPELIEHFRLGYANRTLACRLAPKQYKAGAEMRTALQRVGILRDSGHEHFNAQSQSPVKTSCPSSALAGFLYTLNGIGKGTVTAGKITTAGAAGVAVVAALFAATPVGLAAEGFAGVGVLAGTSTVLTGYVLQDAAGVGLSLLGDSNPLIDTSFSVLNSIGLSVATGNGPPLVSPVNPFSSSVNNMDQSNSSCGH